MYRYLFLIIITLTLTACTTMVRREYLPYPLTNEDVGEEAKVITIPLPVIASSPNEGITAGALTAFLVHNKRDEITTLLAPQVNQNPNFGTTFTLYGSLYPAPDRSMEFNLSRSTRVNEDYEFRIRDNTFLDRKLELNAFAFSFTDGSARFFGFQPRTRRTRETNYADEETGFNLSAGYQIGSHFQLVFGERYKKVDIGRGAITSVPYIRNVFPRSVPGVDGFSAHAQKLSLIYSTLDSPTLPTYGGYMRLGVESSSRDLGSSADYRHYDVEMKGFVPADKERCYISAFRLAYNQTLGGGVPFPERSILGGENTLRGYGRNRFIDSSYLLLNLEERIRVFRWEIFGVNADWEVAPFIDLGAVMKSLDQAKTSSFEFNPGLGVRAVVRPNILGRVDVGFGKDGPSVFVGLGYPF